MALARLGFHAFETSSPLLLQIGLVDSKVKSSASGKVEKAKD